MNNEKRHEWLLAAISFVIDNLSAVFTVGFASYVIYRQELTESAFSTNELLTAILAVLGLLSVSEIVERYRKLTKIEKTTGQIAEAINSRVGERPPASLYLQSEKVNITDDIRKSKTIYLSGINLAPILEGDYFDIFNSLKENAKIRILIVEPKSPAFYAVVNRGYEPIDAEYHLSRSLAAFKNIEALHRLWCESQQKFPNTTGIFEVRMISSYAPTFGLLIFDPEKSHGKIIVTLFPHKTGYKMSPRFLLAHLRDGEWYRYFLNQFDEMWQDAKEWQPESAQ